MTDERTLIVAWLRREADKARGIGRGGDPLLKDHYHAFAASLQGAARQIERGDHMKGINNG